MRLRFNQRIKNEHGRFHGEMDVLNEELALRFIAAGFAEPVAVLPKYNESNETEEEQALPPAPTRLAQRAYQDMTNNELRRECKKRNLTVKANWNKAQYIKELLESDKQWRLQ